MKKAFTLIELLIVIAVLGTLATFVIVNFTGTQGRARDTRRKAELRQYQNGLEIYANSNNSLFPVESSAVNAVSLCAAGEALEDLSCADDPQAASGWLNYQYISTATGTDYVLWAELEIMEDSTNTQEFFVLCSTGDAGVVPTAPSSDTCPL